MLTDVCELLGHLEAAPSRFNLLETFTYCCADEMRDFCGWFFLRWRLVNELMKTVFIYIYVMYVRACLCVQDPRSSGELTLTPGVVIFYCVRFDVCFSRGCDYRNVQWREGVLRLSPVLH